MLYLSYKHALFINKNLKMLMMTIKQFMLRRSEGTARRYRSYRRNWFYWPSWC